MRRVWAAVGSVARPGPGPGARAGVRVLGGAAAGREATRTPAPLRRPGRRSTGRRRACSRPTPGAAARSGSRTACTRAPTASTSASPPPPGSRPSTGIAPSCRAPRARCKLFGARNMVFEGFELRHTGPGAQPLVVQVQMDGGTGSGRSRSSFRDNVFHDSYEQRHPEDQQRRALRRAWRATSSTTRPGSDEHIDVNRVTDVRHRRQRLLQRLRGQRARPTATTPSAYIVIKDSNAGDDG